MTSEIPADLMATAKAVRATLCLDCECAFDRGCGCLDAIAQALLAERERCAKFGDAWDSPSALRLAAGEMTAQEMRTARAVARGISAAIRQQATP